MPQHIITYKNGLRLVVKKIDFVRSVTMGVWVGAGSAYEGASNNGISHFIEHMLFKGTARRSALEIAEAIDNIGAQINAFTAKECTCFYTKSVDEDIETCFDVLSDMYYHSKFDPEETEREKKVVLEEIAMVEDAPEDVCHELLAQCFFEGSTLSRPILGTESTVKALDRTAIDAYMKHHYSPDNTVIAIAGHCSVETADKLVRKYFDTTTAFVRQSPLLPASQDTASRKIVKKTKQIEQTNIAIALKSLPFNDPSSYALMLVNGCLGGGMSSRLFQKVREQMGLAYSVYSYASSYLQNGVFTIYCGTNPKTAEQAVEAILKVSQEMARDGMSEQEFLRGKEQLKGGFILGQENTSSIMNISGKMLLLANEDFDLDEKLAVIKGLKRDDCNAMLAKILNFDNLCGAIVSKNTDIDILKYV